ncbi:MAG: hypothetical protein JWR56_62, partial [Massilia sp.]|nr:hypothetical protein [Massilia sp.]
MVWGIPALVSNSASSSGVDQGRIQTRASFKGVLMQVPVIDIAPLVAGSAGRD